MNKRERQQAKADCLEMIEYSQSDEHVITPEVWEQIQALPVYSGPIRKCEPLKTTEGPGK